MSMPPLRTALTLLFASLVGACGNNDDRAVLVTVIGEKSSTFTNSTSLPPAAQALRSATGEGLVGLDDQGRAIPALADRWIVYDDGLSFIFRLRDGSWPDGKAITAESARSALMRAIAAQRATPLGLDLTPVQEVRTMAGRVIEIRLKQQMPDLLQLLARPELGLLQANRGSGPMKLIETNRKEGVAMLRPIAPEDRGMAQDDRWAERARRLQLSALPGPLAIAMFNDGDADVVLGGRIEDFPRLANAGVSAGAIRLDPVTGLFGLAVLHADGFLSLPENREALAMALDRETLADTFNLGGWVATTRIVAPGLAGDDGSIGERWIGRTLEERRAIAAARVADWRESKGDPAPLRIAMPTGPGGDLLFQRIAVSFRAIGLASRRVGPFDKADLRLIDAVATYARAPWFLNQLSCAARRGLCSSVADRQMQLAYAETDPALRAGFISEAEAELTRTNSFLPIGAPIRWSLVAGGLNGFAPNALNAHPLLPMALRPR